MSNILVTGGTGVVGREVVKGLLDRGLKPKLLVRNPDRARELLGGAVELVRADLMDPASLVSALRGVEVASLATAPGPLLPEQEGNFIEAARAANVRRLVKLSGFGAHRSSDPISAWHTASELRLRASGLPSMILRPVIFMSNFFWEAASIKAGKIASIFGGGRMSFVDPRDVAALTVLALTEVDLGETEWEFGGPEPLSYDDVAAAFGRALGRRVEHVRIDEETFRRSAGVLPSFAVDGICATAVLARQGKFATTDDVIRRKLGRRGHSLEDWLAIHRAVFDA